MIRVWKYLSFSCAGCHDAEVSAAGSGLCPECTEKLQIYPLNALLCPGCGGILDGAATVCSQCIIEPERPWRRAVALFPYRREGKRLIREMKFAGRPDIARVLGNLAADMLLKRQEKPDILIPVPLHWTRLFSRGFNQAELIARTIGKNLQLPVVQALSRTRPRKKQALLGRGERHHLEEAFYCRHPEKVAGKRVMVVDDVMTTGATLSAAVNALSNAGCADICVLVIARTPSLTALAEKF